MSDPEKKRQEQRHPHGLTGDATVGGGDQVSSTQAAAPSDSELTPSELDAVTGGKAVAMGPDLWE